MHRGKAVMLFLKDVVRGTGPPASQQPSSSEPFQANPWNLRALPNMAQKLGEGEARLTLWVIQIVKGG